MTRCHSCGVEIPRGEEKLVNVNPHTGKGRSNFQFICPACAKKHNKNAINAERRSTQAQVDVKQVLLLLILLSMGAARC